MTDLYITIRYHSTPASAKRVPPDLAEELRGRYGRARTTWKLEDNEGSVMMLGVPQEYSIIESREVKKADRDWKRILGLPPVRTTEVRAEDRIPKFRPFLRVGAEPFAETEEKWWRSDGGVFRQRYLLWPTEFRTQDLAPFLSVDEIRKLRGTIPKGAYAEMIAAKLKRT
jgi:hypothetical protein